jgi:hypothetical protein
MTYFPKTLFFSLIVFLFLPNDVFSNDIFWQLQNPEILQNYQGERKIIASKFKLYALNLTDFDVLLRSSALRDDYLGTEQGIEISIPDPNGRMQRFSLVYDPIMHTTDQTRFPEIRTYSGWGLDDKTAFMKCDITPRGFHAMVLTGKTDTWYVDPYFWDSKTLHQVYFKGDYPKREDDNFDCKLLNNNLVDSLKNNQISERAGDCKKRTFRLALAATAEYTAFHSGMTMAAAAMNTTLNRINGIYERELSVRMNLVANNSNLIYTNAMTDPYTNDDGFVMLQENQNNINTVIGTSNFDVGHVFSTGGGGVAYLGIICNSLYKAQGVTGLSSPIGDAYDVDYVAHEMGHQFGAEHTFSANTGSCGGGNYNSVTATEPGSGTTIMAYAGICGALNNVQNNSNDYFSHISITQITDNYVYYGCSALTMPGNNAPTANAGADKTIPKGTPFTLNAIGTDANGDALTYCWEQNDVNFESAVPPLSTQTIGAMIRSYSPTSETTRTIPKFVTTNSYPTSTWEVLPTVARSLNFRLTVRDNHTGGGCTAEDNMIVNVDGGSGPFILNIPSDAGIIWAGNSTQTVTWNVANTNLTPVFCSNVDILLSTDNGVTYGTIIATRPNNGSASITVPNLPTTNARIKVQANNNIFFDVSNNKFSITAALPVELLKFTAKSQKNAINLAWSTASERDNKNFELQRSTQLNADFETIALINGHGNSNQKHDYQFVDNKVEKGITYYYRLKQNDFDEKFHFSNIVSANLEATLFDFNINPNPVFDFANVQLHGVIGEESALKFAFSDLQGKVLRIENAVYSKNSYGFNLSDFPSGLYFLSVETEKGRVVKKLWKE